VQNKMNDIVVVDDNPVVVGVLVEVFKRRGYTVRTASDGFSALRLIRDCAPGIVLSDLNMPGMSGFELLSVVRRRFPMIAVIAMSGAYSGVAVPAGVAADGFYAKGSGGVARLFEILNAIDDEEMRQSMRAAAPIWIPGLPAHRGDLSTMAVACPECLRAFTHSLQNRPASEQETCCPHCLLSVRLAIVKQADEMDRTVICRTARPTGIGNSAFLLHTRSVHLSECHSS
jgi:CheY-like chemotaxis protein